MLTALQHLTVTLNDHEVQGLSGFEAPDNIQLATIRRGSTGDVAAFSAPQRGGPVSITLEPDSPSLPFFLQQMKVQMESGAVVWNGCVKDIQHGCILRLERGVMTTAPMGTLMDRQAHKTFTFEFERIRYEVV